MEGWAVPPWLGNYDANTVRFFVSHPTLEPTLVNKTTSSIIRDLIGDICQATNIPSEITSNSIDELFRIPGERKKKGRFAFEFSILLRETKTPIDIPVAIKELFDYIYDPPVASDGDTTEDQP